MGSVWAALINTDSSIARSCFVIFGTDWPAPMESTSSTGVYQRSFGIDGPAYVVERDGGRIHESDESSGMSQRATPQLVAVL